MSNESFIAGATNLVKGLSGDISQRDGDISTIKSALVTIREKAQKFVDKVDNGTAYSVETYSDMKFVVGTIDAILHDLEVSYGSGESK